MDGRESLSHRGGCSFQNQWRHSVPGDTKGHCEQKTCMETTNVTQTQKTAKLTSYVFSGLQFSAARITREKGRIRCNLSKMATVFDTNGSTSNICAKISMTPCNAFVVTTCKRSFFLLSPGQLFPVFKNLQESRTVATVARDVGDRCEKKKCRGLENSLQDEVNGESTA